MSRTTYFAPSTETDHELRSPFPGNPTQTVEVFGSPPNVLTVRAEGFQVGTLTWNSATTFTWFGPLLPVFPIPVRERLETRRLRVMVAVIADEDVVVRLDRFRVRVPDTELEIPPRERWLYRSFDGATLKTVSSLAAGERRAWSLVFPIPAGVDLDRFDLVIDGVSVRQDPAPPITVRFSRVRGWRFGALP